MADASIIIDGGIVADPRWNTPNGNRVGNLTVRAGRSRKNDQGGYDQLSSTPYDVACWNEIHDLLAAQMPEKGSQVRITGTVTGVRTYEDNQGQAQASVEVRAEGVKVWPKRQQQGGYQSQPQQGYGQQAPQQGYSAPPQSQGGYDSQPPF
ncbi:single-stranded DNA-binding protein [Brachybacterium alimentarium]|uniref:single-stranded DNA-binding protein n=1 Tax=Brachybacterium alimentarium TaxID=47845 RepID=UPI003FCF3001